MSKNSVYLVPLLIILNVFLSWQPLAAENNSTSKNLIDISDKLSSFVCELSFTSINFPTTRSTSYYPFVLTYPTNNEEARNQVLYALYEITLLEEWAAEAEDLVLKAMEDEDLRVVISPFTLPSKPSFHSSMFASENYKDTYEAKRYLMDIVREYLDWHDEINKLKRTIETNKSSLNSKGYLYNERSCLSF